MTEIATYKRFISFLRTSSNPSPLVRVASAREYSAIVRHHETVFIDLKSESGNSFAFPMICRANLMYWANSSNQNKHYPSETLMYFIGFSLLHSGQDYSVALKRAIKSHITELVHGKTPILIDVANTGAETRDRVVLILTTLGLKLVLDPDADEFIVNYVITIETSKVGNFSKLFVKSANTKTISCDKLGEEELNEMWTIYSLPFNVLADQHPVGGALSREAFRDILTRGNCFVSYSRSRGRILSYMVFLEGVDGLEWLDTKYYRELVYSKNQKVYYVPTIVTRTRNRGKFHSAAVILSAFWHMHAKDSSFVVAFECSTISNRYIPRILEKMLQRVPKGVVCSLHEIERREYYVGVLE